PRLSFTPIPLSLVFFFSCFRHLLVLHSFPTRRSSDLCSASVTLTFNPAFAKVLRASASFFPVTDGTDTGGTPLLTTRSTSWSARDRKSTRLNSSHVKISYAVFCLKKKKKNKRQHD